MKRFTLFAAVLLVATAGSLVAADAQPDQSLCLIPANALPIFVFQEDGTLSLERMPTPALKRTTSPSVGSTTVTPAPAPLLPAPGGWCNGQTVDCGGDTIQCPSSGGPACGSNETCECRCDTVDFAAYNVCVRG